MGFHGRASSIGRIGDESAVVGVVHVDVIEMVLGGECGDSAKRREHARLIVVVPIDRHAADAGRVSAGVKIEEGFRAITLRFESTCWPIQRYASARSCG